MIKKCYLLRSDKSVTEELGREVDNYLWDVDEDYTTKREYIKAAKAYTKEVNEKFNLSCTWQELFGEPEETSYRYCTCCGNTFWADDSFYEHDCEDDR